MEDDSLVMWTTDAYADYEFMRVTTTADDGSFSGAFDTVESMVYNWAC